MYRVQLKPGCYHGINNQHEPGQKLTITDEEFSAFGDKFLVLDADFGSETTETAVEEEADETAVSTGVTSEGNTGEGAGDDGETVVNLDGLSVSEILTKVETGEFTAQAALDAENATGKPRKSLVAALTRLTGE